MRLTHLSLAHFRLYHSLELDLPAGPILLHGMNAQGKTSLLEAVHYLATAHSPHTASDRQLINWLILRTEAGLWSCSPPRSPRATRLDSPARRPVQAHWE